MDKTREQLRRAYQCMFEHYGPHQWWPGETPFEVCVGAILTQNTAWTQVERAITNLKQSHVLDPRSLFELSEDELAALIRPAGYYNVKARRLRSFLQMLVGECEGRLELVFAGATQAVRERLLGINGIGPETADSMLLYAGEHQSFVIDAYTRRIFSRHAWCGDDAKYEDLKRFCETSLNHRPQAERLDYWRDYHAQLVNVGKDFCRPQKSTVWGLPAALPVARVIAGLHRIARALYHPRLNKHP